MHAHRPLIAVTFILLPFLAYAAPRSPVIPPKDRPSIGFIKPGRIPQYSVYAHFGIEQWEAGRPTTHRFQQWFLSCDYPDLLSQQPTTYCSLSRVVIIRWKGLEGVVIKEAKHYLSEGTLRIINADWLHGRLDIQIVHEDRSTAEVWIDMEYRNNAIYMKSFRATGTSRGLFSGEVATIEYRIPEYTYIIDVPVEMRGIKSKERKSWDELRASLSAGDLAAFDTLMKRDKVISELITPPDHQVRAAIPDWDAINQGERNLTHAETEKLALLMRQTFLERSSKVLREARISKEGQQKIQIFFMNEVIEKWIGELAK